MSDHFETGSAQTLNGSVNGGTQNLNYIVSGLYSQDDGPFAAQKLEGLAKDLVRRGKRSFSGELLPDVQRPHLARTRSTRTPTPIVRSTATTSTRL